MKLVEVISDYHNTPKIDLTKLPSMFDVDLLVDMVKEGRANVHIYDYYLGDALYDVADSIVNVELDLVKHKNIPKKASGSYEYEMTGGFKQVRYLPAKAQLAVEYSMRIDFMNNARDTQNSLDTQWIGGFAVVGLSQTGPGWSDVKIVPSFPSEESIDLTDVCLATPDLKTYMA